MRLLVFPGARLGAARPGRPLGCCDADGDCLFEQIRRSKERGLLSIRPASGTGKLTADWIKCDRLFFPRFSSPGFGLPDVFKSFLSYCHISQ